MAKYALISNRYTNHGKNFKGIHTAGKYNSKASANKALNKALKARKKHPTLKKRFQKPRIVKVKK